MSEYDLVIRGGTIVDGRGSERRDRKTDFARGMERLAAGSQDPQAGTLGEERLRDPRRWMLQQIGEGMLDRPDGFGAIAETFKSAVHQFLVLPGQPAEKEGGLGALVLGEAGETRCSHRDLGARDGDFARVER
jgi:hypothetical protein